MKILKLFVMAVLSTQISFAAAPPKGPSKEMIERIKRNNARVDRVFSAKHKGPEGSSTRRPYAEYEPAASVMFSEYFDFGSESIKKKIAQELPAPVELIVTTDSWLREMDIRQQYEGLIDPKRLKILVMGVSGGFWTRDHTPIPLIDTSLGIPKLTTVDSIYYHGFEVDYRIAEWHQSGLLKNPYNYEGGNFLADSQGRCFLIANPWIKLEMREVLKAIYGCTEVHFFPHLHGIGHIDEVIKLVSDKIAITDTPEYRTKLESLGFEVREIPRPKVGDYRSYVNSLIVNATVFVPIYGEEDDAKAIKVYEDLGLKVVPIRSEELAEGLGSIHCITMSYPAL